MNIYCRSSSFKKALLLTGIICLLSSEAFSADISGKATTFLNARETVFEENVVRIYEYVDLSARDMGETGVSLNAA
ncbi:MAG: hypothetical protein GWO28_19125, partial [candidate division Zixibacteria bacterium]|nr:hypothetical protein [candidate division Zixibacteria bacterium]